MTHVCEVYISQIGSTIYEQNSGHDIGWWFRVPADVQHVIYRGLISIKFENDDPYSI